MTAIRSNAGQLAKALRADAAGALRAVDDALHAGAARVAREARNRAPKGRSTLTNSTTQARSTLNDEISIARLGIARFQVVAQARYAVYVEDGAGPGGWPPMASILDWMQVHRITPREPGMSQESLARLIQLTIHRRGTPAQPFMQPALEDTIPVIEAEITKRLQRVIDGAAA